VYAITQEGIRRSGLTSIPEIFAPGAGRGGGPHLANQWAITARGCLQRMFMLKWGLYPIKEYSWQTRETHHKAPRRHPNYLWVVMAAAVT